MSDQAPCTEAKCRTGSSLTVAGDQAIVSVSHLGGKVGIGVVAVQHALQLLVKGGSIQRAASQYAHELVNVCSIPLQQS